MKPYMQGKGRAAPDQKPSPSVNMANLTRLSVLVAEANADRSGEIAGELRELGVRDVTVVEALAPLLDAMKKQAFDVLICAERLGDQDGVAVLRAARKFAPATRAVLTRAPERAGELVPEDIEAIELPLSRPTLQGLLHRTASTSGGLWCEVPELSLSDILQMYHQARHSITVLLSGPIGGRIRIEAGEIVDAEADDQRGLPALSRLLEAESGLVRTELPEAGGASTISAPFQSVILEAAHRLDERRRDSMVGPGTAISSGTSMGHSAQSAYPPLMSGPDPSGHETTSATSSARHPALAPMFHALAPSSEAFLAPKRRARRQTIVAVTSLVASLAFAGLAVLYLRNRLDISPMWPARDISSSERAVTDEPPPGAAASARPSEEPAAPPAPTRDEVPSPAAPSAGLERPPDEPEQTKAALQAAPSEEPRTAASSFQFHITSKPSRATVSEAGRVLGKTPLTLTIRASSVVSTPREFVVRLPGHIPVRLSRGASQSNVNAAVVLSPRPAATDNPDAGTSESDLEPARPESPGQRRKDLGIRLRR
jgi:CheY-like chemotaxis protein